MTSPLVGARRVVVISPHLDDGVLSVGAAIALATRRGSPVDVLTVFGCDPSSTAPAGGWDRRASFKTEGDAARRRREEDRRACAILGARPVWLTFGSTDYERHDNDEMIRAAVVAEVESADVVLLPGFPLTHPDHDWLARGLAACRAAGLLVGLYAEQPYTRRSAEAPRVPDWLERVTGAEPLFRPVETSVRDRIAKWRAIAQYRSQLPLLGMKQGLRRGPPSILRDELIAWTDI